MDIEEAIRSRKSIRGYKPDPVPQEILRQILEIAVHAPSAMNTQPWEITVVTGEALEKIRQGNTELYEAGAPWQGEIPRPAFQGEYRRRQVDLAIKLFQLMGITREDKEKRKAWTQRGFRFFDAPAAFVICLDKSLDESVLSLLDVGALTLSICLAALKFGLGTCIEDQAGHYVSVIREATGIPESKRIIICIAVGYPDWSFPANKIIAGREPLESNVTWLV